MRLAVIVGAIVVVAAALVAYRYLPAHAPALDDEDRASATGMDAIDEVLA
jgi:hypothetical protein